jgi:Rod binding domain-containing protein
MAVTALNTTITERFGRSAKSELAPLDLSRPPAGQKLPQNPEAARHAQLEGFAQKWVAQTFFGAMLRQMRNSPFKSELFSGGHGGDAFQQLYDQHMAERMARGAGRSLAASIVRHIERQRGVKKGRDPEASPSPDTSPTERRAHVPPGR